MKERIITVRTPQGESVSASLLLCPDCEGTLFLIYKIGDHYHLQCPDCGGSFCQGGCKSPEELNRGN